MKVKRNYLLKFLYNNYEHFTGCKYWFFSVASLELEKFEKASKTRFGEFSVLFPGGRTPLAPLATPLKLMKHSESLKLSFICVFNLTSFFCLRFHLKMCCDNFWIYMLYFVQDIINSPLNVMFYSQYLFAL